MHSLNIKAPAKVNITLEVLGKRPDGYHEIRTVMQTIDLCDTLTVREGNDLRLECDHESLSGTDNLVLRAARLLKETMHRPVGATIALAKRIPASAGLGGGSSDAAATLVALNTLWSANLPPHRLVELASQLGSDVPFFVRGGTAIAEGRGELIRVVADCPPLYLVLLFPPVDTPPKKTGFLYDSLDPSSFSRGEPTSETARAINRGELPRQELWFNVFEETARMVYPALGSFWRRAEEISGNTWHLAGSGPTLFAPYRARTEALSAASCFLGHGVTAVVSRFLGPRAA